MVRNISVADEVKEILEMADRPMMLREINAIMGYKYTTSDINKHIRYWVHRGTIKSEVKEGYQKIRVYSLSETETQNFRAESDW